MNREVEKENSLKNIGLLLTFMLVIIGGFYLFVKPTYNKILLFAVFLFVVFVIKTYKKNKNSIFEHILAIGVAYGALIGTLALLLSNSPNLNIVSSLIIDNKNCVRINDTYASCPVRLAMYNAGNTYVEKISIGLFHDSNWNWFVNPLIRPGGELSYTLNMSFSLNNESYVFGIVQYEKDSIIRQDSIMDRKAINSYSLTGEIPPPSEEQLIRDLDRMWGEYINEIYCDIEPFGVSCISYRVNKKINDVTKLPADIFNWCKNF